MPPKKPGHRLPSTPERQRLKRKLLEWSQGGGSSSQSCSLSNSQGDMESAEPGTAPASSQQLRARGYAPPGSTGASSNDMASCGCCPAWAEQLVSAIANEDAMEEAGWPDRQPDSPPPALPRTEQPTARHDGLDRSRSPIVREANNALPKAFWSSAYKQQKEALWQIGSPTRRLRPSHTQNSLLPGMMDWTGPDHQWCVGPMPRQRPSCAVPTNSSTRTHASSLLLNHFAPQTYET